MPYKDKNARRAHQREASERWRKRHLKRTRADALAYYWSNREKLNAQDKRQRNGNKEYWDHVSARLRKAKELVAGRPRPEFCEICGRPPGEKALCFDHCHQRGHFRGWLCSNCNTVLGLVNDDPERLLKLAAYLKRTQINTSPQLTLPGV